MNARNAVALQMGFDLPGIIKAAFEAETLRRKKAPRAKGKK
jgi:hypothetical protein